MPETKELVINTTPALALIAAAGSLDMLPLLYRRVWVPWEVCREIQAGGGGWLRNTGIRTVGVAAQANPACHPFTVVAKLS